MKFKYKEQSDFIYCYWLSPNKEYVGEYVVDIPDMLDYVLIYKADDDFPAYVPKRVLEYLGE